MRNHRDFEAVFRHGRVVGSRWVQVRWSDRSPHDPIRFGVVVKKSTGGAVMRNRTKRQLRSIVHSACQHMGLEHGVDIVLAAREPLTGKKYHEASEDLLRIMENHGIGTNED